MLEHPDEGEAWFIVVDGERVGYFVLTTAYSIEFAGRFALLDELYIREQERGKGIGSETLRFIEERSRAMGSHAVRLEAGYDNAGGVRFYERQAYRREQRYLMTKRLD
jgi:GNAT superfamily N-acetyltransferase